MDRRERLLYFWAKALLTSFNKLESHTRLYKYDRLDKWVAQQREAFDELEDILEAELS